MISKKYFTLFPVSMKLFMAVIRVLIHSLLCSYSTYVSTDKESNHVPGEDRVLCQCVYVRSGINADQTISC